MAKKRKRAALPRCVVYALDKRWLVEFVGAVESLRHYVEAIGEQLDRIKALDARRAKRAASTSTPATDEKGGEA